MATSEKRPRRNQIIDDDEDVVVEQVDNAQSVIAAAGSVYQIGQSRQVEVTLAPDKSYIKIMRYYTAEEKVRNNTDEQGTLISMDREQVRSIVHREEKLKKYADRMLLGRPKEFKFLLGRDLYVSGQSSGFVLHIRRYWLPPNDEEWRPTKCGISIRPTEFLTFLSILPKIVDVMESDFSSSSEDDE